MIKYFLIIALCLIGLITFGQYDGKGEDEISRFRPGLMWFYTGLRPAKIEKVRKYDRLIFDVTYNDWSGDKEPFENHWASIGLNTNLMFDIPLVKGNKIALGIGIAHQYINIRHDQVVVIDDVNNSTSFYKPEFSPVAVKSFVSGNSFSIPIELRFRNESWRHFKVHIGGKIGYQANIYSKETFNVNGHKEKNKRFSFPDQSELIYSAHVRVGLRNIALYGSYNFNTLFTNKASDQLNLLQFGISISLF